jgi:hypothetical protein
LDLVLDVVLGKLGGMVVRKAGDGGLGGVPVALAIDVKIGRPIVEAADRVTKSRDGSPGWTQPSLVWRSSIPRLATR